ncbi:MAG: metallophosphatase family protein [Hyphomicrobiaceae bacterium]|nr:metallophosphatase family protein [Hyphomicrobiaceae bacterium]
MNTVNSAQHVQSRTRDLGRFDAPVLVCGGAYSNLEAFKALLAAAERMAIPKNHIVHTGDVIAYCADAAATADLLHESGAPAILGNVEESLAASSPDCGCGFNEGSVCDKLAAEWFSYADAQTGPELRRWMQLLPYHLTFELSGRRVRAVHGSVQEVNRFMFSSLPDSAFEAEFAHADADIVVAGHSGIPFTRQVGSRVWHNSGSVGLPANDGTPRVWFSVLTPERDGVHIEHHAFNYDHELTKSKMLQAGVCTEYAETLSSGVWPSLDVLPDVEKQSTGKPLDLSEPVFCPAPVAEEKSGAAPKTGAPAPTIQETA